MSVSFTFEHGQLDDRAGPAVGDDERQRALVRGLHVQEVDPARPTQHERNDVLMLGDVSGCN
jgi:hypothetical protein